MAIRYSLVGNRLTPDPNDMRAQVEHGASIGVEEIAAALVKPQLAIDVQKLKGAAAHTILTELNRYLRDDLRAGMERLKDTHPDAYKALHEASQVDDPAYRQRKAKQGGGTAIILTLPKTDTFFQATSCLSKFYRSSWKVKRIFTNLVSA